MNSTDRTRSQYSGGRRPTNEANTAPATPAKNDEMANADQLVPDLGHAHDLGGDVAVADRLQRPARPGAHEVLGDQQRDDQQGEAEQVGLGVAADVEPQPVPVVVEGDGGSSSFHHLNSSGGKSRPTSAGPEISGNTRDRWMPMKTSPTVTMPRYRPAQRDRGGAMRSRPAPRRCRRPAARSTSAARGPTCPPDSPPR